MKKIILMTSLLLAMCLALSACSAGGGSSVPGRDGASSASGEGIAQNDGQPLLDTGWQSMVVTINGTEIALHKVTLAEFCALSGFVYDEDASSIFTAIVRHGDSMLILELASPWDEPLDCYIYYLSASQGSSITNSPGIVEGTEFILPGGVRIGDTLEDAVAAYGEYTYTYEGSTMDNGMEYDEYVWTSTGTKNNDGGVSMWLKCDVETGEIYSLDLSFENMLEQVG